MTSTTGCAKSCWMPIAARWIGRGATASTCEPPRSSKASSAWPKPSWPAGFFRDQPDVDLIVDPETTNIKLVARWCELRSCECECSEPPDLFWRCREQVSQRDIRQAD